MNVSRQFCYTYSTGEDIYLFELRNAANTKVVITNYGAIILSLQVKNKEGKLTDIVLGFDDPRDYSSPDYIKNYPWLGCAIGRYANRIKDATFVVEGKHFQLTKNNGNDQLHGGAGGFDRRVWQYVSSGDAPCPFLELMYKSKDGEEGFPGNLTVNIRFELNDDNELSYEYRAMTDKATPVNLTHHSYFNFNNGAGNIHDHELRIYGSHRLEQGENLVATGGLIPTAGTVYDFSSFRKIGNGLSAIAEYDNSYVMDKTGNDKPALVAEARGNGIHLQVYSTEPVVHFYSGKWIPALRGKGGIDYGSFSGFCLETHKHPNAVNIPQFPDTILRPGEVYFQKTTYKINP